MVSPDITTSLPQKSNSLLLKAIAPLPNRSTTTSMDTATLRLVLTLPVFIVCVLLGYPWD